MFCLALAHLQWSSMHRPKPWDFLSISHSTRHQRKTVESKQLRLFWGNASTLSRFRGARMRKTCFYRLEEKRKQCKQIKDSQKHAKMHGKERKALIGEWNWGSSSPIGCNTLRPNKQHRSVTVNSNTVYEPSLVGGWNCGPILVVLRACPIHIVFLWERSFKWTMPTCTYRSSRVIQTHFFGNSAHLRNFTIHRFRFFFFFFCCAFELGLSNSNKKHQSSNYAWTTSVKQTQYISNTFANVAVECFVRIERGFEITKYEKGGDDWSHHAP